MKNAQTKNTIAKHGLCLILFLFGESLLSWGLYWPVLISLLIESRSAYYLGFGVGLLLSLMTGTRLGLASGLIVVALLIFEIGMGKLRANVWLTGSAAVLFDLATDHILGLSWSFGEGTAVLALTWVFWKLGYFADEVHLSR